MDRLSLAALDALQLANGLHDPLPLERAGLVAFESEVSGLPGRVTESFFAPAR
jgi:hypothetical protein